MYILAAMLALEVVANALVRPLSHEWYMKPEEVAALQAKSAAAASSSSGSSSIGKGRIDSKAALAWAVVLVPILWGIWQTLQKTAALF